jgi:hypothetical protein
MIDVHALIDCALRPTIQVRLFETSFRVTNLLCPQIRAMSLSLRLSSLAARLDAYERVSVAAHPGQKCLCPLLWSMPSIISKHHLHTSDFALSTRRGNPAERSLALDLSSLHSVSSADVLFTILWVSTHSFRLGTLQHRAFLNLYTSS